MSTRAALRGEAQRLLAAGLIAPAIQAHVDLLKAFPDEADAWFNLAWLQQQARRFEAAIGAYRQALLHGASAPAEVHTAIAALLAQALRRPDDAETEPRRALAHDPRHVPAWMNLGNLAEQRGQREAARAAYEAVLAVEPAHALALARLAGLVTAEHSDAALINRLRDAISEHGRSAAEVADLAFALGRLLDQLGRCDEAFEVFQQANRRARDAAGGARYDPAIHRQYVDELIATFAERPLAIGDDSVAPVFICGMFRSGSSLVEQILGSHPSVAAGGEIDVLPIAGRACFPLPPARWRPPAPAELLRVRDAYLERIAPLRRLAPVVTDKRPDNVLYLGLIKSLFPAAKIVHTRRNAVDNCLSIWFQHLGPGMPYAYDLEDTSHWHLQQQRLMDHWRTLFGEDIVDVDYDALVVDPRPLVAGMLSHCGLPWNERCLAFHQTETTVRTPSAWQVREPLYRSASGRWRRYETHLQPLLAALGANR